MNKDIFFSKNKILKSAISPYNNYCVGYPGEGNYLTALTLGFGAFEKTFSHSGSEILDGIVAFDKAEISEAYLGQINMITVSSFCGPQGLIWGYDIAKEESIPAPPFILELYKNHEEFKDIKIKNGENLRKASKALFGTVGEKHFPLLPGAHVPCACRSYIKSGPATLYGITAIGIPENRREAACVLMEDVGKIHNSEGTTESIKEKLEVNAIKAVLKIGELQKIRYQDIFVDSIIGEAKSNEMACVLVAMPYFLLAKGALSKNLIDQDLKTWAKNSQKNFLCRQ